MKKNNFKLLTISALLGLSVNAFASPKSAGEKIVNSVFDSLDVNIKKSIVYEKSLLGRDVYQFYTPNNEYVLYDESRELIFVMTNPLTKTGTSTKGSGVTEKDYKEIGLEIYEKAFKKHYPNIEPKIEPLKIGKGLYLLTLDKMKVAFDIKGEYLGITGQPLLYKLGESYTADKDKIKSKAEVKSAIKNLTTIEFKAPKEKHVITVFYDVACPYCNQFLQNHKDYLDSGFTLRIAPYALNGTNSPSAKLMGTILQSKNPKQELLKTLNQKPMNYEDKNYPLIDKNYKLGNTLNIKATPSFIIDELYFYNGLISAEDLNKVIKDVTGK